MADHQNTAVLPLYTNKVKKDIRLAIVNVYNFFLHVMLGKLPDQSIEEQVAWCTGLMRFLLKSTLIERFGLWYFWLFVLYYYIFSLLIDIVYLLYSCLAIC